MFTSVFHCLRGWTSVDCFDKVHACRGMDRGVDKDAVQAAAASLQESVIQGSGSKSPVVANAQAESDKGAQNDEDVMDSSTDTSSNVDEAAMRVAAQHLQENVVNDNTEDEHEHAAGASASTTSAGSEASAGGTDDGVLVWATASVVRQNMPSRNVPRIPFMPFFPYIVMDGSMATAIAGLASAERGAPPTLWKSR